MANNYFTPQTPPEQGGSLTDLTSWMQDQYSLGGYNADKYMQDQARAAQDTKQDAMNWYNTAVQGMQGQYADLNQQMQQGLGQQQDWMGQAANAYNTGQVPQAYQNYLQQSRDSLMDNVISDMNKYYQDRGGNMVEQLASRGILDSSIAGNALNQFEAEQQRQLLGQSNQLNAQMFQQLANAPQQYGSNLANLASQYGNVLQGNVGTQAGLGAKIPGAIAPMYQMGSGMAEIPMAMQQHYQDALTRLWENMMGSATSVETAKIGADASKYATDAQGGDDWLTGIGGIVGSVLGGGLF